MTTRRAFLAATIGAAAAVVLNAETRAAGRPGPTVTVRRKPRRGPAQQVVGVPPPPKLWRPGAFVRSVDVPSPMMALSFDDGPSPYNTDRTLRALERAGATATFFMIGVNVRAWPDIARRVRDAGHEIGNHSVYHRPYRASALANQIGPNQNIIFDAVGMYPVANRAPGLTRGSVILNTCAAYNMYECHTDRTTSDWVEPRWAAWRLVNQFSRVLHPGLIGLYHDGGNRRPTPDAVPQMVSIAQSSGYQLMTTTNLVNSGLARPGGVRYGAAEGATETAGVADKGDILIDEAAATALYGDEVLDVTCDYDPVAEMMLRLDDPTTKSAERSRIVEVLADLETYDAESLNDETVIAEVTG